MILIRLVDQHCLADRKDKILNKEPKAQVIFYEKHKPTLSSPHGITLIVIWLISTVTLLVMLIGGVRDTGQFREVRYILHSAYVLALIWYLIRTGPSLKQLPDLPPHLLPNRRIGKLIPPILIALLFIGEIIGVNIWKLLMILATIWILILWRREIQLKTILIGPVITVIALLAGLPFYHYQIFDRVDFIVLLTFVTPMFVAGDVLSKRTGLVGSQLYTGNYRKAAASFLWGCALFIPLGLTNAAAGSPGPWMTWVDRWWEPLFQPWFSGIVEEAWARLFLVTLCYFLLRPAFNKRPGIPIICAVLYSAIAFGLGHGGTFLERLLETGLLYGGSMAVVFARRDYEHAVGAHYMINFIPTLIVFLGG